MTARFIVGDVFDTLAALEPNSVDLVLTSPPFLALRSYLPAGHPDKHREIGSEPTPADFIDTLLDVVEACDRVLTPHGSICVELGDTYSGSGGAGGDYNPGGLRDGQAPFSAKWNRSAGRLAPENGAPYADTFKGGGPGGAGWPLDKSLCGIPQLFMLSLAYGRNMLRPERQTPRWRVRNVVAWCRPNPPVGALADKYRPATSYLTVACKSRSRYFDLDAVRDPRSPDSVRDGDPKQRAARDLNNGVNHAMADRTYHAEGGAPPLDWWQIDMDGNEIPPPPPRSNTHARLAKGVASRPASGKKAENPNNNFGSMPEVETDGSPPLDWWKIPTQPYPGAHYATWPQQLCVTPIKSMCPQKVCTVCGQPSRRIVSEPEYVTNGGHPARMDMNQARKAGDDVRQFGGSGDNTAQKVSHTVGWSECACQCEGCNIKRELVIDPAPCVHKWRPGLVLDPFAGSGTTLQVATGHGLSAIGIDLDPANAQLAVDRVGPLLLTVETLEVAAVTEQRTTITRTFNSREHRERYRGTKYWGVGSEKKS